MRNNRRFRISAETKDSVSISAKHLRKALRAQGVKVKTETLTNGLNALVNNIGQGKTEEATPVYNQAGDTLALAYQSFVGGDIETAFHMTALAFTSEDCRPLMDAVVKCNDEAKPDDADDVLPEESADNNNDNNDNNDDITQPVVDTGKADVVAADRRYRDKLTKSIKRVTASIIANTDDNNNNDNHDFSGADDDDNDDNDNNNDNNNNNDDAAEKPDNDEPLVGDNMPAATAKIFKRLKSRPDVIAAANKISLGGSNESRKVAHNFIRKVGNLGKR